MKVNKNMAEEDVNKNMAEEDVNKNLVEGLSSFEISLLTGLPQEVDFPKLEDLAEEFGRRNYLSGLKISPYKFLKRGRSLQGEYNSGLILRFGEGEAVLSSQLLNDGEMEIVIGGLPNQLWSAGYVLSGKLKGEQVNLAATIDYSRNTRQEERKHPITQLKRFENVPYGEFRRRVLREDNSSLWFIEDSRLRGISIEEEESGNFSIFLPYAGEGCELNPDNEGDKKLLGDLRKVNDIDNPWKWGEVYNSILKRVEERD